MLGENDWGEDFQDDDNEEEDDVEDEEEVHEVELRVDGESRLEEGRVSALYSYSGEEEGTLALEPGQQFRWEINIFGGISNFSLLTLCIHQGGRRGAGGVGESAKNFGWRNPCLEWSTAC